MNLYPGKEIKLVPWSRIGSSPLGIDPEMEPYFGKTVIIKKMIRNNEHSEKLFTIEECGGYAFMERWVEKRLISPDYLFHIEE